ncbi:hypothetical protein GCM10022416_24640 [Actinomadura keratinilytica]|uniref:Uncharacterized protein n=1 Tax=Actinomadura keratinilytica TaxID=547461 RepID=A0ABP7YNF2_9ACTN
MCGVGLAPPEFGELACWGGGPAPPRFGGMSGRRRMKILIALMVAVLAAGALPPPHNPANALTGHLYEGR